MLPQDHYSCPESVRSGVTLASTAAYAPDGCRNSLAAAGYDNDLAVAT